MLLIYLFNNLYLTVFYSFLIKAYRSAGVPLFNRICTDTGGAVSVNTLCMRSKHGENEEPRKASSADKELQTKKKAFVGCHCKVCKNNVLI